MARKQLKWSSEGQSRKSRHRRTSLVERFASDETLLSCNKLVSTRLAEQSSLSVAEIQKLTQLYMDSLVSQSAGLWKNLQI